MSRCKWIDKEWKELKHSFVYTSQEDITYKCFYKEYSWKWTSYDKKPQIDITTGHVWY